MSKLKEGFIQWYTLIDQLPETWQDLFVKHSEILKPILNHLTKHYFRTNSLLSIFPVQENVFNAFKHFELNETKIVILGQDPYPTRGHAHGYAFSIQNGINRAKSLIKIFETLGASDVGFRIPNQRINNLIPWASRGILLLNTALTIEEGKSASHLKLWYPFTREIIREVSENNERTVFCLWGKEAQKYIPLIDGSKHIILTSSHPASVFYTTNPTWECDHFKRITNEYVPGFNWNIQ